MLSKKFTAVAGAAAEATDDYFKNTTLLLSGDGTNGAQNNTFLDSGPNTVSITRNGNTTQGSYSPYGSLWSNYFDGSTSFVNIPTASSIFALGTGALTVEAWVFVTKSSAYQGIFSTLPVGATGVGFGLYVTNADKLAFSVGNGSAGTDVVSSASISFNTWVHVAATRAATTGAITLYINGTSAATGTSATPITNQDAIVGRTYTNSSGSYLQGYISNVRVSNTVRTITVPTAPYSNDANTLFLVSQSNRFIDNSSNALPLSATASSVQRFSPFNPTAAYSTATIGGSGYFDGSGDYLTFPYNSTNFQFTGDFTIECWVNLTSRVSSYPCIVSNYSTYAANGFIAIFAGHSSTSTKYSVGLNGADGVLVSTSSIVYGMWTHVAVSRTGSTLKLFVNGVAEATTTNSTTITGTANSWWIGAAGDSPSTTNINGYVNDLRITKGGALYTTAFTPPTAPLTTTVGSGTVSLLTNFTNAGIYDNAMMNDLETVGNAQISTSVKKYGTGSIAFDGSGDYLKQPYTPNLQLSGNFTIEFWVNVTSKVTNFPTILNNYSTYAANGGFAIFAAHNSGTAGKYNLAFDGAFPAINSSASISYGTWQHIALVRNGTGSNNITLYVDGTSSGTYTSNATVTGTANNWWIGTAGDDVANGYLNGYIDDLRITKGYARYTSNFTAPTEALPAY